MTRRAHISLETKLASALLALGDIPYEDAKLMTAAQICSLYHFDHYPIRHDDNGPSEPWNLIPRLIDAHRKKTAKVDRPQMAKADHLSDAHTEFRRKILARPCGQKRQPTGRWPRRPMRASKRQS